MRTQLTNKNCKLLRYGIREIVDVYQKFFELDPDFKVVGENIGDPVAKSWTVPPFLKDLIKEEIDKPGDKVFGYSHSRGQPDTRKWITEYAKRFSPSSKLGFEDVLITNGLGAAIGVLYAMLGKGARVLQPSPTYPPHASLESFAAGEEPITYSLNPLDKWHPDIEHMEEKIKANPGICGILVINPNNPTGSIYSKKSLEKIVDLAEKYKLFIISDEVYFRMVYNGHEYVQLTEVACGRVPLIVMRGISKDVPWPGGRCGWLEFHNCDLDEDFRDYAESVKKKLMMEVCSVSLAQTILPKIYDHKDYPAWLDASNKELESNGNYIASVFEQIPELIVNRTNAAFYMMPLFKDGVLNNRQTLPIKNALLKEYTEKAVAAADFPLDKRFAYYLLASTGICVVPASAFYSPNYGFRVTTLERDSARRKDTYERLAAAVRAYLST